MPHAQGHQIRHMAATAIITQAVTTKRCSFLSMIAPNPTKNIDPVLG